MNVKEILEEVMQHLNTLQDDEAVRRCRELVKTVIAMKFGAQVDESESC